MIPDAAVLCRVLNYQFNQPNLFTEALTHRSKGYKNNERLEFLGDAILNFIITDTLYRRFPAASEGEMSRYRASLVRGETLAELAREIKLGDYLIMGQGELKSGGFARDSVLANCFEAIIGAMYLDGGLQPVTDFLLPMYQERLDAIPDNAQMKDPKTQLQEHMQALRRNLPVYDIVSITGEAHSQEFKVICHIELLAEPILGSGSSRRRAEQDAAQNALKLLGVELN